jgi:hypothetical protein
VLIDLSSRVKYWINGNEREQMKIRRNIIILSLGILLVLAGVIFYIVRISQSTPPVKSTPIATYYGPFLFLFLPGLTILIIYGMVGIGKPSPYQTILVKVFLILILLGNIITAVNYLLVSVPYSQLLSIDFYLKTILIALSLANILFSLVVWNGYKWGFWGFVVSSFFAFVLNFIGGVPIVPIIFGASEPVVLYFLIRPAWSDLE